MGLFNKPKYEDEKRPINSFSGTFNFYCDYHNVNNWI